jgi:hypothetical protein
MMLSASGTSASLREGLAETRSLAFLLPLSTEYPDIAQWYMKKVVPGLSDGTRKLISVERDGSIVGIGIAKKDPLERKICTVRVAPSYFGRGIGPRLFDGLLRWLETDRPHLTISQQKLPLFERIFDRYGFKHTSSHTGLYVPGVTEHGYNHFPISLMSSTTHQLTHPAQT